MKNKMAPGNIFDVQWKESEERFVVVGTSHLNKGVSPVLMVLASSLEDNNGEIVDAKIKPIASERLLGAKHQGQLCEDETRKLQTALRVCYGL